MYGANRAWLLGNVYRKETLIFVAVFMLGRLIVSSIAASLAVVAVVVVVSKEEYEKASL